jgi:hypothetical protein
MLMLRQLRMLLQLRLLRMHILQLNLLLRRLTQIQKPLLF